MASYSLSKKSNADLEDIYEYSIRDFGLPQAQHYLSGLHDRFQALVDNPMLGRNAERFAAALRRIEYQSHIVFIARIRTAC